MQESSRDAMDALITSVERWGSVIRTVVLMVLGSFVLFTLFSMYDMSSGIQAAAESMQGGSI